MSKLHTNKSRKECSKYALFVPILLMAWGFSSLQTLQAQVDNLDPDGNKLINITTTAQLNAMRYDLDGNGYASVGGGISTPSTKGSTYTPILPDIAQSGILTIASVPS